MGTRKLVTPGTLEAVGSELAGEAFDAKKTQEHAQIFETIMGMIASLRELPLKEVEPAVIYRPIEAPKGSGK